MVGAHAWYPPRGWHHAPSLGAALLRSVPGGVTCSELRAQIKRSLNQGAQRDAVPRGTRPRLSQKAPIFRLLSTHMWHHAGGAARRRRARGTSATARRVYLCGCACPGYNTHHAPPLPAPTLARAAPQSGGGGGAFRITFRIMRRRWCRGRSRSSTWCPMLKAIRPHLSPIRRIGRGWPSVNVAALGFSFWRSGGPLPWRADYLAECYFLLRGRIAFET